MQSQPSSARGTTAYDAPYPSVEHLQKLFDSSLDVICSLDAKGHFIHASGATRTVWGYEPGELIGRNCHDFILEEDRAATCEVGRRICSGQNLTSFENRYRHRNGTVVPMQWSARWDAEEAVMYCVARDASEKKAAEALREQHELLERAQARYEATLTEQHNRLAGVLERITEGFLMLDEEGRVVYWNREAEAVTGVPREALLGKSLWEAYPYPAIAEYLPWYESLRKHEQPEHRELYSPISQRYLEFNVYPSKKDFSVFFRDISARKQAEEELHRLSLVARETVNAVVLTDSNRNVVWVNSAFTRLTGYSFEEALGQHSSALFDGPHTDADTVRHVEECFARRQPFHIEVLNYKKNGDTYWADVSCQPIFDEAGKLQQFFSIATDITERKRLQEDLAREQQQRQHKITAATIKAQETERALVGQELHDNVNQVLTTVKLYTELCLSGIGNSEELMQKSVRLLQESINEIRSLSKRLSAPSLGSIRLKESVKELAEAVSATNRLRIEVDTKGIDKLDVDQEVHLAVYRILQEHLTNVLKHSEATVLRLIFTVSGGALTLIATDDGKGFDTRQKRTGIGITNMVTRAESLGGTLSLASQPGRGCTLLARFPLVPHKEEGWVL
ncbi:MAG TPA: PAS domain S-box protein [Chitinophagaceae bacterium]